MRKTVRKPIFFEGIGLHTGKNASIVVRPSNEEGIIFLKNGIEIFASVKYKSGDMRGTSLSANGITVNTVEHLLSALYALGVTDCVVEFLKGEEIPILDGSALPFAEKIAENLFNLDKENKIFDIEDEIIYTAGDVIIKYTPSDKFIIDFLFDGSKFGFGKQHEVVEITEDTYLNKIAPARTFGFWEEIEYLMKNGLAVGGTFENALVIKDGMPYKTQYRMENELVLHKILDFIGDLSLLGGKIKGYFKVERSGHFHNTEFVKRLLQEV